MKALYRSTLFLAVAANLSLQASPSQAQGLVLEEVVVTAQKRVQRLQDVPVAVSAISGATIEQRGITRIEDLERMSPSLSVNPGIKSTQSGLNIRGIGNYMVFGQQVEPAVLVVYDEVSQVQSGQAFSTMIDVERVEVLRGPQNTLFGKNASAGVVNIVSRAPTDEFSGSTEVTLTDDEEQAVSGTVAGPLTATLGYRLTGYYSDRDGFIRNIEGGDDLQDRKSRAIRGKLRWQPTDDLDLTLSANYDDTKEACCSFVPQYISENAAFIVPAPASIRYLDMLAGVVPGEKNTTTGRDDGEHQDSDSTGASVKLEYALGEYTLTSITAYNQWNNVAGNDIDFSGRDVAGDFIGIYSVRSWDDADRQSDFTSQELRLTSPEGETLDYLLGMYYSKIENNERYERFSDFPPIRADDEIDTETDGYAAFGQAAWHLTEATTLSAGLRYNHEEISADVQDFQDDTRIGANDNDDVWLGKVALQHNLLEDTMLYASIATGYKGQAYDTSIFSEEKAQEPVAPEESTSYETGVKSIFADGRAQVDLTAFFTTYDDFQAQDVRLEKDGTIEQQLLNVGELETYGAELESSLLVSENFRAGFAAAYTHAEVTDWDYAPCYALQTVAEGCDTVLSAGPGKPGKLVQASAEGNQLPMAPEWKFTLNGDYNLPLEGLPLDFFANFNYVWQDEVNYDIKGSPRTVQDGFGIANLSVGIVESSAERYQVTAFVNNVFDEFYSGQISDGLSGTVFTDRVIQRLPVRSDRYAGLRVKYAW